MGKGATPGKPSVPSDGLRRPLSRAVEGEEPITERVELPPEGGALVAVPPGPGARPAQMPPARRAVPPPPPVRRLSGRSADPSGPWVGAAGGAPDSARTGGHRGGRILSLWVTGPLPAPGRSDGYRLRLGPIEVSPEGGRYRFRGPVMYGVCLRECAAALARAMAGRVEDAEGRVLESWEQIRHPLSGLELRALWLEAVAKHRTRIQSSGGSEVAADDWSDL